MHGGIVQGVAQALWEEAVYDDDGNLRNPTLVDYLRARRRPRCPSFTLDHTVTPSPTNPLGVKGIGEAGTIGRHPGRHQRHRRRAVARSASPTSPCRPRPSGCGDAIQEARKERRMIPAAFDYVRADSADEAIAAARRSTATTPSSSPAATRCCR